jgi:integrase
VIAFLNTCGWASGTKDITIDAYRDYLNMLGLTEVKLPHIRREEKLPFVPLEEELDAIISSVRTKMATFLRVLKDTGARPIEAWTLKWTDISTTSKCVTITPAKYNHARKLGIAEQTLNMLQALPKKSQYVFSSSGQRDRFADELEHFAINFVKARTRIHSHRLTQTFQDFFQRPIKQTLSSHVFLSAGNVLKFFLKPHVCVPEERQ